MTNLTAIQTSPAPEQVATCALRGSSIAARSGAMRQNRIGALLLLVTPHTHAWHLPGVRDAGAFHASRHPAHLLSTGSSRYVRSAGADARCVRSTGANGRSVWLPNLFPSLLMS